MNYLTSLADVSISDSVDKCVRAFKDIISLSQTSDGSFIEEVDISLLEDYYGRFRVWAGNIGAHQTGKSSLEYRLRDDSEVREQVIKILQSLLSTLNTARETILSPEPEERVEQVTFADDDEPQLRRMLGFALDSIHCLYRMTMLIRKPAQSDFRRGNYASEMKAFYSFDLDNFRNKYPRADDGLLERLASASCRRRGYLHYRSRHHAKLSRNLEDDHKHWPDALSSTIPTTVHRSAHIDDDEDEIKSMSAMSETSFATTMLSESHSIMPRRPKQALDGPFECPYCYCVVTTATMHSWIKHIFDDLRPYVCTALACSTPGITYNRKHQWQHHMQSEHRSSQNPHHQRGMACPLCQESQWDGLDWFRHVAKHLQEIALFVLRDGSETSDESEQSTGIVEEKEEGDSSSEDGRMIKTRTSQKSSLPNQYDEEVFDRPPKRLPTPKLSPLWMDEEHHAFILLIREHGTDWKTIAKLLPRKDENLLRNFYRQEARKGHYGETLMRIAQAADGANGRATEVVPETSDPFLMCQVPGCDRRYRDGLKMMAHAFSEHSSHRQADLWNLNEETGHLMYNGVETNRFKSHASSDKVPSHGQLNINAGTSSENAKVSTDAFEQKPPQSGSSESPTFPHATPEDRLGIALEPADSSREQESTAAPSALRQISLGILSALETLSVLDSDGQTNLPLQEDRESSLPDKAFYSSSAPPSQPPPPPPPPPTHPPPLPPRVPIDPYEESLWLHRLTRVKREEVNREALDQAGIEYEDFPDYWNVLHPLNEQEIVRLRERTRDIRWAEKRELDEMTEDEE
ncbi:uncharacterized protein KY384_008588 [Bacidia gigantensis]|uniref:uncharacterized protein n=1 Tax=Bacidia gigantensis TaxID=2732470 RepID=UPI001D05267C|nr:uncharacterized protein KY384_008588 [Bacidia gigantensis]KAG8527158.1 hypothetical protein KY384_008588 [Bacidia gigantensis]